MHRLLTGHSREQLATGYPTARQAGGESGKSPQRRDSESGLPPAHSAAQIRLRAVLKPLDGRKYYGSEIELYDADQDGDIPQHVETLTIWAMGDYSPSERELAAWDEDEYGPWEGDSSHYESAFGYRICQTLVEAINSGSV